MILKRLGLAGRKPLQSARILDIPFIGRVAVVPDPHGSAVGYPGGIGFHSKLEVALFHDGRIVEVRDLGSGVVTTAGVNLMGGDWTNATATLKLSNFHDSSTGITAAAIGDTALATAPPAGVPGRATGTQSNVTNAYKTIGTQAYTATLAITEWGLFTAAAQGPTLWDRKVFTAINVVSGDSIQFTYTLTITAGG